MKLRRDLVRRFSNYLPEWYRIEKMRQRAHLDMSWPSPSLEIKIAETQQEFEGAYRLVHDSYVKAGYMNPAETSFRILPQNMLPQSVTIVAKWDGQVVGTVSLIRDNPLGLPLEKIFDVSERRRTGRRLAEPSSLAVDPKFRGQSNKILYPLFRFIIQYARHRFGVHEFVVATNPSLAELYSGVMAFERMKAKPLPYSAVNGVIAVGLFLDFETADERWKRIFGHRPESGNFHRYWTEIPNDPRNMMPQRVYDSALAPGLTPDLFSKFFFQKARMGESLTYRQMRILIESYPRREFQKVLVPVQSQIFNRSMRLATCMKATLGWDQISAEVLNVSRDGILLRAKSDSLTVGHRANLGVWLNSETTTSLSVEVCRHPSAGLFGLRIHDPTPDWLQMVASLELEVVKEVPFYPMAA